MEVLKNVRITEIMKVKQDVLKPIEINKLRWYGHIRKTNEKLLGEYG